MSAQSDMNEYCSVGVSGAGLGQPAAAGVADVADLDVVGVVPCAGSRCQSRWVQFFSATSKMRSSSKPRSPAVRHEWPPISAPHFQTYSRRARRGRRHDRRRASVAAAVAAMTATVAAPSRGDVRGEGDECEGKRRNEKRDELFHLGRPPQGPLLRAGRARLAPNEPPNQGGSPWPIAPRNSRRSSWPVG